MPNAGHGAVPSADGRLTPIVLEDLNGDGKLDVVTVDGDADAVAVRLGYGDGTFAPETLFPTGSDPSSVTLTDVDDDEHTDLLVGVASGVSSLLGRGDGTFGVKTDFAVSEGWLMAVFDANEDGLVDLVASRGLTNDCGRVTWSRVSVLLGRGDGSFTLETGWWSSPSYSAFPVDVNADRHLDLVVAYYCSDCTVDPGDNCSGLGVVLGDGHGGFTQSADVFNVNGTFEAASYYLDNVFVTDVDRDGKSDITACDGFQSWLWSGNGDGTFAPRVDFLRAYGCPYIAAMADLNQDQRLGFALGSTGRITVVLDDGEDGFREGASIFTRCENVRFAVGDLNADARQDIVIRRGSEIDVRLANSDGTYGESDVVDLGFPPHSVAAADFDHDERTDLVVTGANKAMVLRGNGDGSFTPGLELATGTAPSAVAVADLNRDGDLDVAVVNTVSNSVSVFLGNGDGTFEPGVEFPTGTRPSSVAVVDLDEDGNLDLAVTNNGSNNVFVLRGKGDGALEPGIPFATGQEPSSVIAADLNGDGYEDLAVANSGSDTITLLLGTGDIRFAPILHLPVGTGARPISIAAGDLSDSEWLELVTANRDARHFSVLSYDLPRVDVELGAVQSCVAIGDLNVDGKPEIVVGTLATNGIEVLSREGTHVFRTLAERHAGCFPIALVIARVNHDDRPDVVVANLDSNTLSVLLSPVGPVAVSVEAFSATCDGGPVSLSWGLSAEAQSELAGVFVERGEALEGPFAAISTLPLDPRESMYFLDVGAEVGQTYWYRLVLLGKDGERVIGPVIRVETIAARLVPTLQVLGTPSHAGSLEIRYTIPRAVGQTRLAVYDVAGRMVRNFGLRSRDPGPQILMWDGRGNRGDRVARGIYVVELMTGDARLTQKAILLRP